MMTGEWSRWGVSELFEEFSMYLEDGDEGKGVWDWSACLTVSPILQSQSETFVSARSSRRGQEVVFQHGRLVSLGRGGGVRGSE
jgi:hypothetical protein